MAAAALVAREYVALPLSDSAAHQHASLLVQPLPAVSSVGVGASEARAGAIEGAQRTFQIFAAGSTGTLLRPFQFFGGDNRGRDPNGSYRYRQDATVYFGSAHRIVYNEWMGTSMKYACRWPTGSDCIQQATATAPLSERTIRLGTKTNSSTSYLAACLADIAPACTTRFNFGI